ncbi:MAG: ribosome small subunit-dependent GTPase A [Candidatus Amulumruptor caecigallinarius]|nr:ribosome small subunit-dependent GTPase A [Candidatus Amulumruptor caecigallinarius]MCM1396913.1 ribosome small subunit-dependent GTPase A [Candidatus Amulumruptor caecigallinarius]MCM1454143.1 ribosome small subunit-dependent GTPase A [bacterium]
MQGLVIKNTGNRYDVLADDGSTVTCNVKGNFRLKGIRTTNPVAVGDHVTFDLPEGSETGYITAIEPRRNYIIRRASNLSKESHILAANIDQVALIVTLAHPATSLTFIDRLLATAEAYGVEALLVINKTDLLTTDEDREMLDAVSYLYRSIGYPVMHLCATTGEGLEELRQALSGKITLLSGNSGVGKSTIINDLLPEAHQKVAEISATHLTGMHTTTFSEMFALPGGGYIIDTPGVKGFGTIDFDVAEVSHYFPEIFKASEGCRYGNCTHTHEPGCEVRRRLAEHLIAESRYASYLSILEDAAGTPDKYRKPY